MNEIIRWVQEQSVTNMAHYIAAFILVGMTLRIYFLKKSRDSWKALVKMNCTEQIRGVVSSEMTNIKNELKDAIRDLNKGQ